MIKFALLFLKHGKVRIAKQAIRDSTLDGTVDWPHAIDCYLNRIKRG